MAGYFKNILTLRETQPTNLIEVHSDYAHLVRSVRQWNIPAVVPTECIRRGLDGFAKTGTIDAATSSAGIGVKGDGSTGLYSRTVSVVPQAMWIAVQFVANSVTTTQKTLYALGSAGVTSAAYCGIFSGNGTTSEIVVQFRAVDSGPAISKVGLTPVAEATYTVVAVFPSALKADAYFYVNGIKYTTDFSGSVDISFAGPSTLVNEAVGALKRGTTAVYGSDTVLFTARGLGQIPESLAKQFSENIYSSLQYQERNVGVSTASGAPTASQTETCSAAETSSVTSATTAAGTENGSVTETSSITVTTSSAISESGTAAETTSADIGALSSSQVESGNAAETSSVTLATTSSTAESGASVETSSVTFSTSSVIAETGTALETSSAIIAGQVTTATTLVITKITGTFAAGNIKVGTTTVGTCTGAQSINGASTAKLRAQYTNLAADVYRALITPVPGSGSLLGVWMYNDVVYAFRNTADGLSAAMYKSTTSGWSLVPLGRELSYTSGGTYNISVGDTITGETSGATAIITALTIQTGTLAAGTAAGRIIFVSQTGTFQAETIKVGANLNVANIAGNSTAITFAVPGGRFEFGNYNFGTTKMYGVDGKNRGFEFDGTTFVPIATGMAADTPTFLWEHKSHLFYAFSGSAQHSGIGTPYIWAIVSGASELAMGDTITGFKGQTGSQDTATLIICTRNGMQMLYGTSSANWVLVPYKPEAGAYPYTIQQIGLTLMLDDRGITSLETSQNYGNFMDATLSKHIQTWINARRSISVASCIVRDKNQYRLFFSDGSALYVTMDNGKPVGMLPIQLTHTLTCICSLENNSGDERIYFGDTSGYVHQMDVGTSFDGSNIEFYMYFAYNNFGSPRVLKSFKNAVLEVAGNGYAEFGLGYNLGYASTEIEQASNQATTLSLAGSFWDAATWDQFTWDAVNLLPSYFSMCGDAENISFKILGSSDYYSPLRFSGVLVSYVVRRALR